MMSLHDIIVANEPLSDFFRKINGEAIYINEHSTKVCEYSVKLGKHIGISKNDLNQLIIGSYLHDIGEVAMEHNRLIDFELTKIDYLLDHPIVGAGLFSNIDSYEKAKEIILLHHERIDGTGFPYGLFDYEIPYLVKIVSICDEFVRLTEYNNEKDKIYTNEGALNYLMTQSGKKFNENLLNSFSQIILK